LNKKPRIREKETERERERESQGRPKDGVAASDRNKMEQVAVKILPKTER
jgi:hypothetical protein